MDAEDLCIMYCEIFVEHTQKDLPNLIQSFNDPNDDIYFSRNKGSSLSGRCLN